jgi:transcriptional regulator with GAF, ATPase, and Fis domain
MTSLNELYKKALDNHRKGHLGEALNLYLDTLHQSTGDNSHIYGNLGSIYFEQGELTTAIDFLKKGLLIAKKYSNDSTNSTLNRYLGRIYRHQGKFKMSLNCLQKSEKILQKMDKDDKLLSTLVAIGETYLDMRNRDDALHYLNGALHMAREQNDLKRLKQTEDLLMKLDFHKQLDTLAIADMSAVKLEKASVVILQEINTAINSQVPLRILLALIVDKSLQLTTAGRGFLLMRGDDGEFSMGMARGAGHSSLPLDMDQVSRALVKTFRDNPEPLLIESLQEHPSLKIRQSIVDTGINSILAVPIKRAEELIGMFYLDAPMGGSRFSPADMENLSLFAVQTGIALETARLIAENQKQKEILEKSNRHLKKRLKEISQKPGKSGNIMGESNAVKKVRQLIARIADTDLSVIIQGASGTGKELIAEALHAGSSRSHEPFVKENCGAIPEGLLESVLFGHVQGAFTGATSDNKGLFMEASGGTLFLDEISEMPYELQKSLLRVLQEGEIRPVGGSENIKIDVRVICATNRDLQVEVEEGRFRQDLYFRLNGMLIRSPSLSERDGDLPLLIDYFLGNRSSIKVSTEAMALLEKANWPGNIRQLQNEVNRWLALGITEVTPENIHGEIKEDASRPTISGLKIQGRSLKEIVQETVDLVEKEIIKNALEKNFGRKTPTAKDLDVSRPTLDKKLKKLGLD